MLARRPLLHLLPTLAALLFGVGLAQQQIEVQPGDTLWGLAQRYGTTVSALRSANALTSDALRPGVRLTLPGGTDATPESYTVQRGDTLYDIALAFHTSVDDLIAYNHLAGTVIRPGQVLTFQPSAPAAEPLVVTVAPGDTLWNLARTYDTPVKQIVAANGLSNASVIRPGQSLTIPGRYASPASDQGGAVPPTITVGKGDSLWAIAGRYHTTVAALIESNDLSNDRLYAGQTLRIVPGDELARARPAASDPVPNTVGGMIWPIIGPITSRFGYRQLRVAGSNFHTGLDIDGVTGDPIHAAVGGTVTLSGWNGGYGNCVIITDGDTEYYYGHASKLLVKVGQAVQVGDVIALVGSTGDSTGSHLHFEIRVDGQPVDPLPILQSQASR